MKERLNDPAYRYRPAGGMLGLAVGLAVASISRWGGGVYAGLAFAFVGFLVGLWGVDFLAARLGRFASSHERYRSVLRAVSPLWGVGIFAFAGVMVYWPGLGLYGLVCCGAAAFTSLLRTATGGRSDLWKDRLAVKVIAAGVVVCFILLYQGVFIHDGWQYQAQLESIVSDRDLSFFNNVRLNDVYRTYNPFPDGSARYLGTCLANVPFWVMGRLAWMLADWWRGGVGCNVQPEIVVMVNGCAGVFYGALGLVFCWFFLRVWFGRQAALAAILLCAWASPLPFFMFSWSGWPHVVSFCLISAFLVVWAKTRVARTSGQWAALGVLAGTIALVRPIDTLACAVIASDFFRMIRDRNAWLRVLIICSCAAFVAFSPQLILWKAVSGKWFVGSYSDVGDSFRWLHPDVLGLLFSPQRHGLFVWHPVFGIGFVGLFLLARKERAIGLSSIAILAVLFYMLSVWSAWWTGVGFGNRFFIGFIPLFAIGLAAMAEVLMAAAGAEWASSAGGALVVGNFLLLSAYLVQDVPQGIPEPSLVTDYRFTFGSLFKLSLGFKPRLWDALSEGSLGQGPPLIGRLLEALRWSDLGEASMVLLFSLAIALIVWLLLLGVVEFFSMAEVNTGRCAVIFLAVAAAVVLAFSAWIGVVCRRPPEQRRYQRLEFEPAVVDSQSGPLRIPVLCRFPVRAVDVVAALEYAHGVEQGEAVAVISATDMAGVSHQKTLRAGLEIAETSFLRPKISQIRHRIDGLRIVRARPCRAFSSRRYQLLVFCSTFDLPSPMPIESVQIEYISRVGRLRVEDVFVRDFGCH